jgi:intracellular septation protein
MKKHLHIVKIVGFDMFVIEFGPVGVFLLTFYLSDFITAALALGIATFITLILSQLVNKRVPWFALFSGSVTIVSSFVTYLYTAPGILIFKDTAYYALFATILIISLWRRRSLFQAFFGHIFAITDTGWRLLEVRWLAFFILAAISNEFVRMNLTVEQWVIYKQVMLALFFFYGTYQFRVTIRHRLPDADKWGLRRFRQFKQSKVERR